MKRGSAYFELVQEKSHLMEEFRIKFKNISRIMNCVSCEKCKVWGKLQILGLGTAVRILLTPEQELTTNPHALNRQEIIALINTLHQFTKSVQFANSVLERLQQRQLSLSKIDSSATRTGAQPEGETSPPSSTFERDFNAFKSMLGGDVS